MKLRRVNGTQKKKTHVGEIETTRAKKENENIYKKKSKSVYLSWLRRAEVRQEKSEMKTKCTNQHIIYISHQRDSRLK